tara:strand:+ start:2597 stop:2878 length:282 start_codon:yes stop_codon:yes gene_type:complete
MVKSWWWDNNYVYEGDYPLDWDDMPNRIRLSNGNTKTNKTTFTQEDLKDAGYKIVKVPDLSDFNEETHECYWDGTQWVIQQYYFPKEKIGSDD